MSDEERSRLIAEFEGIEVDRLRREIDGATQEPEWSRVVRKRRIVPDYAHDLNATMRAARRLPKGIMLNVFSSSAATITKFGYPIHGGGRDTKDDPARAAFLALSDYLASREGK